MSFDVSWFRRPLCQRRGLTTVLLLVTNVGPRFERENRRITGQRHGELILKWMDGPRVVSVTLPNH